MSYIEDRPYLVEFLGGAVAGDDGDTEVLLR